MTVYDLIVIGGGFWGTACAVEARERGLDTLLLDDARPNAASRNAAGITTLSWYEHQKATRVYTPFFTRLYEPLFQSIDAQYGVRWMLDRGIMRHTGEEFFYGHSHKTRGHTYLLDSPDAFMGLAERCSTAARRLNPLVDGWEVETDQASYTARGVVLAAGAFTDELLIASGLEPVGVTGLRGRGLLVEADHRYDVPITVRLTLSRYYAIRPWKGRLARIGDTVERKPNDAALDDLRRFAERLAPGFTEIKTFDGLRPVGKNGALIRPVAPGLVVATGGHRVGLALAPRAAQLALEQLEISRA